MRAKDGCTCILIIRISSRMIHVRNKVFNFLCMRRLLVSLNLFYMVVGLLIATLPVYFQFNKLLQSWPITGGIIAMGSLLVFEALIGCYGSKKQHQIILFFYSLLLALLCIITFAFGLTAVALNDSQQRAVLRKGWHRLSNKTRGEFQKYGNCCGLESNETAASHPSCQLLDCSKHGCSACIKFLQADWFIVVRRSFGGMSLFVSSTMVAGVYLTFKFRNYKNPVANPDDFL